MNTSTAIVLFGPPSLQTAQEQEQHQEYSLPFCELEDWPWVWAMQDFKVLDWRKEFWFVDTTAANRKDDDHPPYTYPTNEMIEAQLKSQRNLPVRITDHLYLGHAGCVKNVPLLQSLGINAVLNMGGESVVSATSIELLKQESIAYKQIEAEDDVHYPLLKKHWLEAKEFLDAHTSGPHSKCLVNCMAGINRSSLIVSTYYMLQTGSTVLETVKHIRKQRGNVALHNFGFQEQLVAMARLHNLLGPKPGTPGSVVPQSAPPYNHNGENEIEYDWRIFRPDGSEQEFSCEWDGE